MNTSINKRVIKGIAQYILDNCEEENIEVIDYLINEIDKISDIFSVDENTIEQSLIDRNSSQYKLLVNILQNKIFTDITKYDKYILNQSPFYYVCLKKNNGKKLLRKAYYKRLEYILNAKQDVERGYYYQDLVLIFMRDFGIMCPKRSKSNDGGVDLIGSEKNRMLGGYIELIINLYGQIKCYMYEVKPFEIKQFIKDCIYMSIENGEVLYNLSKKLFFISHKGFTDMAKEFCINHNIIFLDSEDLIKIAIDNETSNFLSEIDTEYTRLNSKDEKS